MQSLLKIWRAPESEFGIHCEHPNDLLDETVIAEKKYTDAILKDISEQGFNAIWIHGQLHHLVKSSIIPEFGKNSDVHLDAIRRLAKRASRYGIGVFLYLQPPRAIPVSDVGFWERHADLGGMVMNTFADKADARFRVRALCTSHPRTREYLEDAFAELTACLPCLEGYILITASEYPAHCYSKTNCRPGKIRDRKMIMDMVPTTCLRCADRMPEEVVSELILTIRNGIRRSSKTMKVIFWNWSWTMYIDPPCREIVDNIPPDCILMVDFERGGTRSDGVQINEYSLGYPGPSELFRDIHSAASARGLPVMAKLQIGTTHELATVCSLPLLGNLYRKAAFIETGRLAGFMGCWNFGNYSSANTAAFNFFLSLNHSSGDGTISGKCRQIADDELPLDPAGRSALHEFAVQYFPGCDAEKIIEADAYFTEAMNLYPFSVPFLYSSIVNHALGLIPKPGPLDGKKLGRSHLPDERGDDYSSSITPEFPLPEIIRRLELMAKIWSNGTECLRDSFINCSSGHAFLEYGNAVICGAVWKSSAILYRIYEIKKEWDEGKRTEYERLLNEHLANRTGIIPYLRADPRQGYHLEGRFYAFSMKMIAGNKSS